MKGFSLIEFLIIAAIIACILGIAFGPIPEPPPDMKKLATECIQAKGKWVEYNWRAYTCVYSTAEKQ